jgi:hypothetical protein
MEPTINEKKFLKTQRELIEKIKQDEINLDKKREKEKIKSLLCMGIAKKAAKGPNPLSVKKSKKIKKEVKEKIKKRRKRKGKRSKALSEAKKNI